MKLKLVAFPKKYLVEVWVILDQKLQCVIEALDPF